MWDDDDDDDYDDYDGDCILTARAVPFVDASPGKKDYNYAGNTRDSGRTGDKCDCSDPKAGFMGAICTDSDEYTPSEDTFFLADYIERNVSPGGSAALDVGSGSGYITRMLRDMFDVAVGTDIDPAVLRGQHTAYRTENLVCCNGSDALSAMFDVAVCNPPYLATETICHLATDGGPGGLVIPSLLIDSVCKNIKPGGYFLFVSTTLSDYKGLVRHALHAGFDDARIVSRKRLFFEELVLIKCTMGHSAASGD